MVFRNGSRGLRGYRPNQRLASRVRLEYLEERALLSATAPEDMRPYLPQQYELFKEGGFLSGPSTRAPVAIAESFLRSHAGQLGIAPSDLDNYILTTNYVTQKTGATTLTFQQSLNGIGVENANFNVTVGSDGRVLFVGGGFVPGLNLRAGQPGPLAAKNAVDASATVAQTLGVALEQPPTVVEAGPSGPIAFNSPSISRSTINSKLHYLAVPGNNVRLTWQMTVNATTNNHWYRFDVDADNGGLVGLMDIADYASYQVFARPTISPDDGPRTIQVNPDVFAPTPLITPSKFGWHDLNGAGLPDFTITHGNNVNAYADRDADNFVDPGSQPTGGTALDFTGSVVPLDLSQPPSGYTAAAVTNLFYWTNLSHDVHYLYGFDEAARNFQFFNYGRGGLETDDVNAIAQAGADVGFLNNAFFIPFPDGTPSLIAMFEWNATSPRRDGDLDSTIIIHEYGHGVSNRITGNTLGLDALQSGGMGEGWSDWWALMLTQKSASEPVDGRAMGTYVLGEPESGPGIRDFRYKYAITDPSLETFLNFGVGSGQQIEPHAAGTRWAATLWDINKLLIDKYGFEPNVYNSNSPAGNIRALHLIMNALKIQPLNPSFIDARDAILAADELLYGGADLLELWTAFARRGLGASASTPNSNSTTLDTSFEIPILSSVSIGSDVAQLEGDSGTTNFVFFVTVAGPFIDPIAVSYATFDGTASAGSDFVGTTASLTFQPGGAATQAVTIQVLGDPTVEADETFFVKLINPVGTNIGARSQATGTILNDDIDVAINDVTIKETDSGTSNVVFTVGVTGVSHTPGSVAYFTLDDTANAGSDYMPVAGVLSIPALATTAFITVPIIGDKRNEADEDFFVKLTAPVNVKISDDSGTCTIIDNDPLPSFYVNDVSITSTQPGTFGAVFTVALDAASGRNATVEFGTADGTAHDGVDYLGQSGTVTFLPGVNTMQVTVPVTTGATYSPNERFFLNLSNPGNGLLADSQGVGTVIFAAAPPTEYIVDDGGAGYNQSPGWTNVTNLLAYGMDYDYHPAGNGSGFASWTVGNLPAGAYQVFTKWVAFSNRATNAPYTVFDGATSRGTVLVNQQLWPASDQVNGITWHSLGTFQISTGVLSVRLTDAANGFVIADAVRIVPNGIPAQIAEIDVSSTGNSIGNGDSTPSLADGTEFGDVLSTTDSAVHTFVIANTGNADLHIGGVHLDGANPLDFVITTQPAALLAPGRTTTFQVLFHPTTTGLRQAEIVVDSDDSDESAYTFAIQGTGTSGPIAVPVVQNAVLPFDVNGDNLVSPVDALLVINRLMKPASSTAVASLATSSTTASSPKQYYFDVSGDGILSPRDALLVINQLIHRPFASSNATSAAAPSAVASTSATPTPVTSTATPTVQAFAVDAAVTQLTTPVTASSAPPTVATAASAPPTTNSATNTTILTPVNVRALFASSASADADDAVDPIFE